MSGNQRTKSESACRALVRGQGEARAAIPLNTQTTTEGDNGEVQSGLGREIRTWRGRESKGKTQDRGNDNQNQKKKRYYPRKTISSATATQIDRDTSGHDEHYIIK